ncbi:MAG: hypothetical protein ABFD24_09605 [Anaerolineaceae bacterium]|jgi:hypothetical protein
MSRKSGPPALSPEDRENLRTLRRIRRQRLEDERLKQQIGRLLLGLQIRFGLPAVPVNGE